MDAADLVTMAGANDGFSLFRAFSTAAWAHNGGCGAGCTDGRDGAGRGRGGRAGRGKAERALASVVARVVHEVRTEDVRGMDDDGLAAFRARVQLHGATEPGDDVVLLNATARAYGVRIDVRVRENDSTLVHEAMYFPQRIDQPLAIVTVERLRPAEGAGGPGGYGAIVSREFTGSVESRPIRRLRGADAPMADGPVADAPMADGPVADRPADGPVAEVGDALAYRVRRVSAIHPKFGGARPPGD